MWLLGEVRWLGSADRSKQAAKETTTAPVRLLPPTSATATVLGNTNWLPAHAHLTLMATPKVAGGWFPRAYLQADISESGTATIDLPFPGTWRFELYVEVARERRIVDQQSIDVFPEPPIAIQFWIERAVYAGRIAGAGKTTPGTLLLTPHPADRPPIQADVDANGTGQPIPGAEGIASTEPSQAGQLAGVTAFQSDLQGHFTVPLDRPARRGVQVIVAPAGRPVTAFRVERPATGVVTLAVSGQAGALRLLFAHAPEALNGLPVDYNLYALISEQGGLIPMANLLALRVATVVPTTTSTALVVPLLAVGDWRVARFPDLRARALYLSGHGIAPVVRRIAISPGREAVVDLRE